MIWEGLTPPYGTIVADPPWPQSWQGGRGGRRARYVGRAYSYLSIDEIAALPVVDLAASDAHLFLWITAEFNREGIGARVARAWGFRPASEFIWDKPNLGMGQFPRMCHEVLLVAVRGRADWPMDLRDVRSVQRWTQPYAPQGGSGYPGKLNSAKPPAALDLIERVPPGPYVELFARQPRLGWDSWGWGYEQAARARRRGSAGPAGS